LEITPENEHVAPINTVGIYAFTATDSFLHLYLQMRAGVKFRYWKAIPMGTIMLKIWYLRQAGLWATAGADHKLYTWNVHNNPLSDEYQVGRGLSLHYDQITDCVEINDPKCICTCSMDRSIVMYDLQQGYVIRAIRLAHDNAIRKLTYVKDYGGYLISASYDMQAKVWQPANIYGEALFGRLKGHNHPIVSVGHFPD
jgi:WD40 repeat protein